MINFKIIKEYTDDNNIVIEDIKYFYSNELNIIIFTLRLKHKKKQIVFNNSEPIEFFDFDYHGLLLNKIREFKNGDLKNQSQVSITKVKC